MKTYRAAVIGRTGRGDYGHGLDEVFTDLPNVELVAVADDDKMGLAKTAAKLKVDQAFSDYRELLDKAKPDMVSIGQRWLDQHRDMVVACAERGIHMYLEKPFCRTLAEADEMVAACEKRHTKLAIAHQTRYSPRLPVAQEILASGKLGRVLEIRGRGKEDARGGSEDLWVLGSHIVDLMRAFAGDPQWCFASVTKEERPITPADVVEGNEGIGPLAGDGVQAMYGFPGGVTGYFASHKAAGGGPRFGVQVYCTGGILEMQTNYMPQVWVLRDPAWSPGRNKKKWEPVSTAGIGEPEPIKDEGPKKANQIAVADLIGAIEENRETRSNIYDARWSIEMIVGVFAANKAGAPVQLPLKDRHNPLASG
jgi:predicted dehydrogenase